MTSRDASARGAVLVTSRSFGSGAADATSALEQAGLTVRRAGPGHDLQELGEDLAGAVAWIAGTAPVTAELMQAAPSLRIVARYGVGVDAVDLEAARRYGLRVTNTPGANAPSVADHTLALLLALVRGIGVTGGEKVVPRDLCELTVGLIGFGHIGREVARRLQGFGCRVLVSDPAVDAELAAGFGVTLCQLTELAEHADVVSLHRPGGEVVVDRTLLNRLGDGAMVVNTARGDLVDEAAIVSSLYANRLGGYATDVARKGSALPLAPRTLVTDHVAAHTRDAVDRMSMAAVQEVVRALTGEPALSPIVEPDVEPANGRRPAHE